MKRLHFIFVLSFTLLLTSCNSDENSEGIFDDSSNFSSYEKEIIMDY